MITVQQQQKKVRQMNVIHGMCEKLLRRAFIQCRLFETQYQRKTH